MFSLRVTLFGQDSSLHSRAALFGVKYGVCQFPFGQKNSIIVFKGIPFRNKENIVLNKMTVSVKV